MEREREREREEEEEDIKADFFPFVQLDRKVCHSDGAWASEL